MVQPTNNRHVNRNAATRQTTLLSWQEALAIIENCDAKGVPIPFAIAFVTADESRHTGGEIIRYERAVWYVAGGRVNRSAEFERIHAGRIHAGRVGGKVTITRSRSPKSNWMKRILGVGTDQIRQLHLHLILEINGQPVR